MDLILTPKNMPEVKGNFDTYKKNLIKQIEDYKKMPLTEDTIGSVKSAIRQIRTTLEKIENTSISAYFDTPKKELKARFSELYSIIAEGESKVDAILAEETRRRNMETTERLNTYIESKITSMKLEEDASLHVILKKQYFNKTAKEVETLNDIDLQLIEMEKNFAAFQRATKKINEIAIKYGKIFNKGRFLYMLDKYGPGNSETASLAEEEAERLTEAINEQPVEEDAKAMRGTTFVPSSPVFRDAEETINISLNFPVVDKKKSKGTEEIVVSFTVPKESKKVFNELLRELKAASIKNKKM